jgi:hypothetical protein
VRFTSFRAEHLKHVGWGRQLRELVRARARGDPVSAPDGLVEFVPVLGEARTTARI